ncbi:flagellar hook-length control protein FliK, partial [Vibrio cholerae]
MRVANMNVNLTPPVEPSKIAPTAKSSAVSTDAAATESSGGFFAQLHALIFGSKTASDAPATCVTQNEGDTEAPVNTEAALEADSDAALMAEMDDALFSASEVEAASEESLPVDTIKSAQKAPSLEKGEAISAKAALVKQDEQGANAPIPASLAKWVTNADESVSGELQRKTAQAMSEGDELLGRLQEANQALIKTNGKILPAQHGPQHPDRIRNATPPEAVLPIESATAISNRALSTSADLDAAVSDSAATEDEIAQDEWMASALMGGALAGGLSGASLAAANTVHAEPVEGAMLEGVPLTQTLANTEALASPSSEVSEVLAAPSQALKATPLTQSALNPASIMADEGLNLPTSVTETGKVAIPWGAPMPTDNELAALTPELKAMLEEGGKAKAPVPNALA